MSGLSERHLDPLADAALPLLLSLFTGLAVGSVSGAINRLSPGLLPGALGFWALLFTAESYLITSLFFVRDHDRPFAFRTVEIAGLLVLAKYLTTPGSGVAALLAVEDLGPWLGIPLLGWAWYQGLQAAHDVGALHPAMQPDPTQEHIRQNDHGQAFDSIRNRLLFTTVGVGALVTLMAGGRRWDSLSLGVLGLALLTAVALLVAAQLRQQATWYQERMEATAPVLKRWIAQGAALLLLPMLAALILPAGPGLPVERLLGRGGEEEPVPVPTQPFDQPEFDPMGAQREMLERFAGQFPALPQWLIMIPVYAGAAVVTGLVLALLRTAIRQFVDRLRIGQVGGVGGMLTMLFRWYAALWQGLLEGLRGAARLAVSASAEAVGAVLGEAGVLSRFVPRRAPTDPRAAVRFYFGRLQADAARKGYRRPPGATAAEFAARLEQAAPERAGELAGLVGAYEQARYGTGEVEAEQASLVRNAWLRITRALNKR